MANSDEPLIPSPTALLGQFKAQLRIWVGVIGGGLVLRHVLPASLVNDQTIDMAVGMILVAGSAAWQYVRTKLVHEKMLAVAADPRVPDDIATVATAAKPANV